MECFESNPWGSISSRSLHARNELVAIGMEYDLAILHRQPPQPVTFL
jgi:hypothetical protein